MASDVKLSAIPSFNASDDQLSRSLAGVALAVNPALAALTSSRLVFVVTNGDQMGGSIVGACSAGAAVVVSGGGAGNVGAYSVTGVDGQGNAFLEAHASGQTGAQAYIDLATTPTADYDWRLIEGADQNLTLATAVTGKKFTVAAPLAVTGNTALAGVSAGATTVTSLSSGPVTAGALSTTALSAPNNSFRQILFCGTVGSGPGPSVPNTGFQDFAAYNQQTTFNALAAQVPFAGSIVAISCYVATGSTQGVQVHALKNGATINYYTPFNAGPGGVYSYVTTPKGSFTFNAGDNLGARLYNVSGSTITSMNGYAYIWVETTP